jgi:hypothetical protein
MDEVYQLVFWVIVLVSATRGIAPEVIVQIASQALENSVTAVSLFARQRNSTATPVVLHRESWAHATASATTLDETLRIIAPHVRLLGLRTHSASLAMALASTQVTSAYVPPH